MKRKSTTSNDGELLNSITKRPALDSSAVPTAPIYPFEPLLSLSPEVQKYSYRNKEGHLKIDFTNRAATLALTLAILKHHFNLHINIPDGHLVPTIPNRVQYLQWARTLLPSKDMPVIALDIGTGPSCIYPLLAVRLFPKWKFIATDIDPTAVKNARQNCEQNDLQERIQVYHCSSSDDLVPSLVVSQNPLLTVCNPPFYSELPTASSLPGTESQLVTNGGEYQFLCQLARESTRVPCVQWFTSLVGCKADVPKVVEYLRGEHVNASFVKTVQLNPGGRTTRWAVAWSFGELESQVELLPVKNEQWRLCFNVSPGRAYANQLTKADIADLSMVVFKEIGWEIDAKDVSKRVVIGSSDGIFAHVQLQLHVTSSQQTGEYMMFVKTERRGNMKTENLWELGLMVAEKFSKMLNEDSS